MSLGAQSGNDTRHSAVTCAVHTYTTALVVAVYSASQAYHPSQLSCGRVPLAVIVLTTKFCYRVIVTGNIIEGPGSHGAGTACKCSESA